MNSSINTLKNVSVEIEERIENRTKVKSIKCETKETENDSFEKVLNSKAKEANADESLINTNKKATTTSDNNENKKVEKYLKENKNVTKETQSKNNTKRNITDEINGLKEQDFNLLYEAKRISSLYNVPRSYVVNALSGNGKFYEDNNGVLTYEEEINKINIGTQRTYVWKEDGSTQIILSSSTGSPIMQLDDEEMKKLLENIDKINETFHEIIEAEKEKEIEEKIIEEVKTKKIQNEESEKSKEDSK